MLISFDCALSGPFNKLRSARFSATRTLCECTICFYLRLIGFGYIKFICEHTSTIEYGLQVVYSFFRFSETLYKNSVKVFYFEHTNLCSIRCYAIIFLVATCYQQSCTCCIIYSKGWLTSILHRMEVMLMKNIFDFKDLLSFGMFLLALLTFIYLICHQYNKNLPCTLPSLGRLLFSQNWSTTLWRLLFLFTL